MNRETAIKIFKALTYTGIYGALLMPLVFIPVVIFPFVFSKLVALQILIGLTFPAYLALAWMDPKYRPPKSMLYYAIIAYFVAVGLSTVFSVDPVRSWWGNQERMNGYFTLLHFFAWLTMTVGILKHWKDWYRILNYEIVLSVIMACVALLQIPFPKLLMFEAGARVGGLVDNPIYMGAYQIFNLAFAALLFIKTKDKLARIWYVIAALFMFAAFAAAQSRGAMVGLAAFIGIFALYYAVFTKNTKVRWGVLSACVAGIAMYTTAFVFKTSAFVQSIPFLPRFLNLQAASETRLIAWKIAWDGFLERPLTGWGFDAFHILFNLKYNPRSLEFGYYETWFDRAHNTVMDVLSMTGILGFVTFFAIFISIFILVYRARKHGWIDLPIAAILTALPVGYFLQNLFVFDHPAAFSMSYLLFALVIAATRPAFIGERDEKEIAEDGKKKAGKTHTAPWIAFTALTFVMALIVWRFSMLPFQASKLSIQANQFMRAETLPLAWEIVQKAGTIPTPYLDEQTFLISRDMIELSQRGAYQSFADWPKLYAYAKDITERHLADHPRNTHPLFIYARLLHEMALIQPTDEERVKEGQKAEEMYRRAIETSPKRQQLYFGLARLYSSFGQHEKALETLKEALSFDENIGEAWWYIGLLQMFDLNMPEEGAKSVLRAVDASSPYELRTVREALIVAEAAQINNDLERLRSVLGTLQSLPGGSVEMYLNIARVFERAGLIEERNNILNAVQQADPSIGPALETLRQGLVDTIDESMQSVASTTTNPGVQGTSTQDGTTVPSGPGPRR